MTQIEKETIRHACDDITMLSTGLTKFLLRNCTTKSGQLIPLLKKVYQVLRNSFNDNLTSEEGLNKVVNKDASERPKYLIIVTEP